MLPVPYVLLLPPSLARSSSLIFYSTGHVTAAPSFGYLASRWAEVPPVVVAIIDSVELGSS